MTEFRSYAFEGEAGTDIQVFVTSGFDATFELRDSRCRLRRILEVLAALRRYPRSDKSMRARYARAIAHFRGGDIRSSIAEIDPLIPKVTISPSPIYLSIVPSVWNTDLAMRA